MSNYDTHIFFHDTATTQIYTLSLHDALPISSYLGQKETTEYLIGKGADVNAVARNRTGFTALTGAVANNHTEIAKLKPVLFLRSEEHTSELQSLRHLVCRLLLEKKKKK